MLATVLKSADTKTRRVAYVTLVRPVLEYGCEVWDPHQTKDIKKLKKMQNKALRFIFRIKGKVFFTKLRNDTCISSLAKRRKEYRLKLFVKVKGNGVIQDTFNKAD